MNDYQIALFLGGYVVVCCVSGLIVSIYFPLWRTRGAALASVLLTQAVSIGAILLTRSITDSHQTCPGGQCVHLPQIFVWIVVIGISVPVNYLISGFTIEFYRRRAGEIGQRL
jgi:hypothetical protein